MNTLDAIDAFDALMEAASALASAAHLFSKNDMDAESLLSGTMSVMIQSMADRTKNKSIVLASHGEDELAPF